MAHKEVPRVRMEVLRRLFLSPETFFGRIFKENFFTRLSVRARVVRSGLDEAADTLRDESCSVTCPTSFSAVESQVENFRSSVESPEFRLFLCRFSSYFRRPFSSNIRTSIGAICDSFLLSCFRLFWIRSSTTSLPIVKDRMA